MQKQPGVVFGFEAAAEAFRQAGAEAFDPMVVEGQWRDDRARTAAQVSGPARALLAGERTALNLLGHLSGIATLTARFVRGGGGQRGPDPRHSQDDAGPAARSRRRAVAAGGGTNHRMGLYDAILIKDNHAALAGGVGEAVRRARERGDGLSIEVECRDLDEVRAALEAGADRLLLDNMDLAGLRESVSAARGGGAAPTLEASGGVTLENVAEVAATGVDFISVGALTHSAPSLDLCMELERSA